MITKEGLARVLYEEFERDAWGDIDPYLFYRVSKPEPEDGNDDDVAGMEAVLERVVARLNAEEG